MIKKLAAVALATGFGMCVLAALPRQARWYKGNTHTHTLWSDGDGAPELVTDWYKSHGYDFLVLSDHNVLANKEVWVPVRAPVQPAPGKRDKSVLPERVAQLVEKFGKDAVELRGSAGKQEMRLRTLDELRKAFERPGSFLMITGEEITDVVGKLPVHHNSINQTNFIPPPDAKSVRESMELTVKAVEEEEKRTGRPVLVHLNHPNFGWGISADDLAYVLGERYFEVYNGHRGVRNYGDKEHLSCERMWDHVLTLRLAKLGGPVLYGLATDDAHNYYREQATANPGRGWVMVRAERLTPEAIVRAMKAGDFYGSSGVVLEDVVSDGKSLTVRIAAEPGVTYTTRFIGTKAAGGEAGVVFKETNDATATYEFAGDELYVRATVVSSKPHPNGYDPKDFQSAWVQPVVVRR